MPITPFHFGPGALIKAAVPDHFSWTVFALANVVIDLEPVSLFFLIGDPAHLGEDLARDIARRPDGFGHEDDFR